MRVLFVLRETNLYARFGIMYLSTALKRQGHEVRLANARGLGMPGLMACLRDFRPGIVAYSVMTGEHEDFFAVNRALKDEFEFVAVVGGPHATFTPGMLEEQEAIDAVCVGEGDIAFPEFCRRVETGGPFWESSNFRVRHEGKIWENPLLPLVIDLDELGFPDHDLMYACDRDLAEEGVKTFYSTRGCPYSCTYCFNRKYNEMYRGKGPVLRHRSPDHFIEEIAYVRDRYPLTNVFMHDDTFIAKPEGWFERFCSEYKRRIGLPMSCCVRANLVRDDLIEMLAKAGMRSIWMGVECGDEEIANEVLQRGLTNEQLIRAADTIRRHGIMLVTQNLVGLPVANSYQADLATVDLNRRLKPVFAWSSILYPYPGTRIQEYAREHGFLPGGTPPIFETNKRSSAFTFASPLEKRRVENLHKLFDLMIRWDWARRHADAICGLPRNALYRAYYYVRFGYVFKWKLFPFGSVRREIGKFIRLFARMIRKS